MCFDNSKPDGKAFMVVMVAALINEIKVDYKAAGCKFLRFISVIRVVFMRLLSQYLVRSHNQEINGE